MGKLVFLGLSGFQHMNGDAGCYFLDSRERREARARRQP